MFALVQARPRATLFTAISCQLGLALAQPCEAPAQSPASDSAIQAIMHQRVDSRDSSGIVVGLLDADGSRHVLAYGSADQGALPLDANSVFDIGSITKVFTGVLLAREAGTRYGYSNVEFGLPGNALARAAGTSYETLLIQRVLAPLGMRSTRISFTPRMRAHLARGHDEFGGRMPSWETPALAGAGALRSTANDLLTFAAASLLGGRGALARVGLREGVRVPVGRQHGSTRHLAAGSVVV